MAIGSVRDGWKPAEVTEDEFLQLLRQSRLHEGARGLADDAAVLGNGVLTTDMIVEGIHFLPGDPPEDVAWKLLAVNLSDLAAKGATPEGVLLGYALGDREWDTAFLAGLDEALRAFSCKLLGGDTVTLPPGSPRVLSLTAIGTSDRDPPSRSGGRQGDALWVTGTIGDAGAGLAIARGGAGPAALLARYRRPTPRLVEGHALASQVHAMMDISDGLLLDAKRMADASGLGVTIDLERLPLSPELRAYAGDDRAARLMAATAGDDYELLFAAPKGWTPPVAATRIGRLTDGTSLSLLDGVEPVSLPAKLGFTHG